MASSKLRTEVDMLSDLPPDVKEKILTYLPIKEAGRTSILSTKWRYTWSSIPELTLIEHRSDGSFEKFEKLVDQVFLLHNGAILKFMLVTRKKSSEALNRWILNLSRNGIRELSLGLGIHGKQHYKINSNFFSCDALSYVNLNKCVLRVPLWFKGFKLLHTLYLMHVSISADDLKKLISSCPLLKKLLLRGLDNFIALDIHAPNLSWLSIRGWFLDIQVHAPRLRTLRATLKSPAESFQHIITNLARVFDNVPHLEHLKMEDHSLKCLCALGPSLDDFPLSTFNHLKRVRITLDFNEEKEAAFVFALFQRASSLRSLIITVHLMEGRPTLPIATFWERADRKEGLFTQLQTVNIIEFRAVDSVLSFIIFVLGSAPQLSILTIEYRVEDKENERMVFNQLLQFPRVSPNAQIIFKET